MPNILLVSATKLEHHDDELFGIPIHIVGVGKVASAINTYSLIQQYNPDTVVNFGSCGNLKNNKVGEVLEVGTVYDDFYGCVVPEHSPIKIKEEGVNLFTTDTFYDKDAVYSNHYHSMINKCDIVDMEGYSIANVCKSEGVFVSLYKWISDDGSHTAWEQNASIGYNNFKQLFYERYC